MENPLELSAPTNVLEQIRVFAFDLAYGVSQGFWGPNMWVTNAANGVVHWRGWDHSDQLKQYLAKKWPNQPPSVHLMLSFRYLEPRDKDVYLLTPRAFALLERPITPPSIFISYKQTESSALALLIESRLKNVDPKISIFIDKNIESGESINSRIEATLEHSQFFICLLGSRTLADSTAVQTEINLTKSKSDCTIVPICHNGYTPDALYTQYFGDNKAIVIKHPESAEEYEINMTRLLIRLGYPTT